MDIQSNQAGKKLLPWNMLKNSVLFSGVSEEEALSMMNCLSARKKTYKEGETVLQNGEVTDSMGLLLSGSIYIIRDDFWGNRNILSKVQPGQVFGEVYAAVGRPAATSAEAVTPAEVLFLNLRRILTTCPSACSHHTKLIRNLLSEMAEKNLAMNAKILHLSQRTTRQKLLSYLSSVSQKKGSESFEIPFSRQELADYLSVDRSAMSSELGRMRDEGILSFSRNHFELKE